MTIIPDAAIKAAVRVLIDYTANGRPISTVAVKVSLEEAMPVIREAIAQEIEAIPYSPELEHGDNGEWMQAEAARTARGAK